MVKYHRLREDIIHHEQEQADTALGELALSRLELKEQSEKDDKLNIFKIIEETKVKIEVTKK